MIITLPWPPSANTYWRHPTKGPLAGRHMISDKGRKYRAEVIRQVIAGRANKGLTGLLSVDVLCYPPDRRRRDLGNLEKGLFDALTHAGVWEDDSQVDDQRFRRARDADGNLVLNGTVVLTITEVT